MGSTPPIVRSFTETFPPLDLDALTRPWRSFIPKFADVDITSPWDHMFDDVLEHHRCRTCRAYLCCGEYVWHHMDCWAENMKGTTTEKNIYDIHLYRGQVFLGAMEGYTDWAFQLFDPKLHVHGQEWKPHYQGFYVRCRSCPRCKDGDCKAAYHNHPTHS